MLISEYVFNHWPEAKKQIHQKWGGLSEKELDQTQGKYSEVVQFLHDKLNLAKFEIEDSLEHMLSENEEKSAAVHTSIADPMEESRHF